MKVATAITALLAASLGINAAVMNTVPGVKTYPFDRVLVVIAHPDDAETICGGFVSQLVAQGTSVSYVVATNGDKGWSKNYNMTSPQLAIIREGEQLAAAAVLGVSNVTFLRQEDGRLEGVDPIDLKHNITQWIRVYQPDLVVTFSPETDYSQYRFGLMHRDHQTAGKSALDSVYPSTRDYLAFPDLFTAGFMPWQVPQIWFFAFGQVAETDVVVNITGNWFTNKYNALLQHKSQYTDPNEVYQGLVDIGTSVAAKNGLDPTEMVEAYQVVNIF